MSHDAQAPASAGAPESDATAGTEDTQRRALPIDPGPIDRLLGAPHRFAFHQAVRLLDMHRRRSSDGATPELRFRNTLSLSFPASEIESIEAEGFAAAASEAPDDEDEPVPDATRAPGRVEITPAFMGLLGATGALPIAYTEQFALRESHGRDASARAFLDIFQHRAVTLFHQAWRKHRLPLQFESGRRQGALPLVLSLVGLGEPALRRRLRGGEGGVADAALAYYAGLLQRRAVSADHLRTVLSDYFGVPFEVTQFVGRWFDLEDDCQARLGAGGSLLGRTAVLGPRVWERSLCVRIGIGPLTKSQHRRFLPGGPAALALRELLGLASGAGLEYEVRLRLRAADVAGIALHGADEGGARLGWDTHLVSRADPADREDLAYRLHAAEA